MNIKTRTSLVNWLHRLYEPGHFIKDGMKRGSIPDTKEAYGTVLNLAWASVMETFFIAAMSLIDTLMVSTEGDVAIAAVGLVTQPRFLVQTAVLSLNFAVVAICARRKGENSSVGATVCLKQGLLLSVILSLILTLVMIPFSRQILWVAGATEETIGLAKDYFDLILLGLPIYNVSLTISAALRGTGNTKASMAINLSSTLISMCLNYLLIGGHFGFPRMGVRGAGVGRIIGWGVGLLLALFFVSRRNGFLFIFSKYGWRPNKEVLSGMFRISSGSIIEQTCMRIGFFIFSIAVARLGTIAFATHQILSNIMNLAFSLGEGYGIASTSLVGQNLGAKRPDLSLVYGKICHRLSIVTGVLLFFVITLLGEPMMRAFSNNPEILEEGNRVLLLVGIIIFGQAGQMIYMGCLRGAGDMRYTAIISLISIVCIRPLFTWVFAYALGMKLLGAWSALVLDQYLRLFLTYIRFSSGKWMSIRL